MFLITFLIIQSIFSLAHEQTNYRC